MPRGVQDRVKDKAMFAVIKTGGKQYRVSADDVITIERIEGDEGSRVEFGQVLMVGEGSDVSIGTPAVEGATVTAEVVEQGRGPKTISFKKRRRQNSRRKKGHRQLLTTVSILEILTGGSRPSRDGSGRTAEDRRRERDAAYLAAREGVGADGEGLVTGSAKPARSATATEDDAAGEHDEEQAAMTAAAPSVTDVPIAPETGRDADEGDASKAVASAGLAGGDDTPAPDGPLFTAPEGEPDKLTKLKGIGPVAERQLNEQGITTFRQIVEMTDEQIEKVDRYMPFSAAQIRSWQEQARTLLS